MTQSPNPQNLKAAFHFLLHNALSAADKRLLAGQIACAAEGLSDRPPAGVSISHADWGAWTHTSDKVLTAVDLTVNWLAQATWAPRRALTYWDTDYPAVLRQCPRPPWVLLTEGTLPDSQVPVLAMVGSRSATKAGLRRAREFSAAMASRGWVIASGLARGIDAAAHLGALDVNGVTIAVMGCGIDVVYPPEHVRLRQSLLDCGGLIVSEYPPGTPPHERFFPARNRLIAGWARGVLVVEAAVKSGSLITAHQANELGRAVMAIPGSIDSPQSRGCHQMIRSGARLVETVDDILDELQAWVPRCTSKVNPSPQAELALTVGCAPSSVTTAITRSEVAFGGTADTRLKNRSKGAAGRPNPLPRRPLTAEESGRLRALDHTSMRVLSLFDGQPLQFDDLSTSTDLPIPDLSACLLQLELDGLLEQRPGQWWCPT